MITDFHTHAFPDALAERAIRTLEGETADARAKTDGRISSLLASMDRAGIGRSVVCSIATKPAQFDSILQWSGSIASDRIVPLASVHPRDPEVLNRISRVAAEGLKGIKLHPYYQGFEFDEECMWPFYARMEQLGLILVSHTGFDIAFPRVRKADPVRIARIANRFPRLKLVTSHLGAWEDWDEVRKHILGKPIFMEVSFSLEYLPVETARSLLLSHPAEYLLFGTDSPWADQSAALARFRALGLGPALEEAILETNASRLLDG